MYDISTQQKSTLNGCEALRGKLVPFLDRSPIRRHKGRKYRSKQASTSTRSTRSAPVMGKRQVDWLGVTSASSQRSTVGPPAFTGRRSCYTGPGRAPFQLDVAMEQAEELKETGHRMLSVIKEIHLKGIEACVLPQVGLTGKHCKMNTKESPEAGSGQGEPGVMRENMEDSRSRDTMKNIPGSRSFLVCSRTKTFLPSFLHFIDIRHSLLDDTSQPHGTLTKTISLPTVSFSGRFVSAPFLLTILWWRSISWALVLPWVPLHWPPWENLSPTQM